MFLRITLFFLLFSSISAFSQEDDFSVAQIPDSLRENADAVVRLMQTDITIESQNTMDISLKRVITILNKAGMDDINAYAFYSNSAKIKSISAIIYDAYGKEIKKIKQRDFVDHSATGESIISDDRILYLDYTPVQFPFTVVFTNEIKTSSTAFIPHWMPVDAYYESVQQSTVNITYPPDLGFRYKLYNFEGTDIKKEESGNSISFTLENKAAFKEEDYSPAFDKMVPYALFSLTKFDLEGVEGEAGDWATFGAWYYNNLLVGTDELPEETVAKVKALVANETDTLEKARKIYEYVQGKTHYIGIQLGIGGYRPMKAEDVDRLGYGDCKALSNYTRALLKAVGINAYCAIIYGDRGKRSIREDFVSMQGNHMVLAIPHDNGLAWLECTSQTEPFDFDGDFTDDRAALILKPDAGEIVHTHTYKAKDNTQVSKGSYTISPEGDISGAVQIVSRGVQYENKYYVELESPDDRDKHYKTIFSNINNLKLTKIELNNNKDIKEFTENVGIDAKSYCSKSGNRYMFAVNAYNQSSAIPQRYRHRNNPFEISRGFYDTDEITINIPEGFTVEAKPENVTITDKFGDYTAEYTMLSPTQMLYKRSLLIKSGLYEKSDYEKYREFREKIAKNDNSKMVLVKS